MRSKLGGLHKYLRDFYLTSRPKPWKLEKPTVIQFPVNDICNSRCQMCNIWRRKLDTQITLADLAQVLASPLFSKVKSVGVNGGEPTLRQDLSDLTRVLFATLPKLLNITLITNALNSRQVIARITQVGKVVKSYNGHLGVMVSLDGVGEIHDKVRGVSGNFENAVKVIDFIQSSDLVHNCRLGCTVIRDNVYGLHDLLEFAIDKDIYIKYRIGIPHQRLYSKDVSSPFALNFAETYHLVIFLENLIRHYESSELQKYFYRSLIGQLVYNRPRTAGCDWQHRGVTLSARGELLYCAVESSILGSAITDDPEKLYFENESHSMDIVNTKCAACLHDYTGLPPTTVLLRHYGTKWSKKVQCLAKFFTVSKTIWRALKTTKQQLDFRHRMRTASGKSVGSSQPKPALKFSESHSDRRKVLICGWYGTETLGDKAILGGVVDALKDALGDFELHLASLEVYISQMTLRQMPELENCSLHTISEAVELADSVDLVILGGGPLMAINPLVDMIDIFQQAVEARVPTLIAGCGVGPLGSSIHNRAIKQLLHLASHRIYRDRKSMSIAQSLGVDTTRDQVAEDPAFTWLESFGYLSEKTDARLSDPSRSSLLLGLRDWPYTQYANELCESAAETMKSRFEQEVIAALNLLVDQFPNLRIVPFPMCTNHIGGDDRWFYRRLFRNQPKIQRALDSTCLGEELSPLEGVKVFKTASVVLAMRFHSLVFALAVGLPVIAVDYTLGRGKVRSLAEEYQVPHMRLDKITQDFIVSQIAHFMQSQQTKPSRVQKLTLFKQAVNSVVSEMSS